MSNTYKNKRPEPIIIYSNNTIPVEPALLRSKYTQSALYKYCALS